MDVEEFWNLIQQSEGDGKRLATLLQDLKAEDIRGFGDILDIQFSKAFNWDLWAAAYLINGGCSEEEFNQFLYWIISLGEERFENVLQDPDVLAEIVQENESTFNDDIIVAIARTLDRKGVGIDGKSNVTLPAELMSYNQKPIKPRGKEWKEDSELIEMYPKLGERFGEMLEWEEDDEEDDWEEEENKNKSKLRKAWDKFIEFFARIFDKFIKFFSKKKKAGEEEEEKVKIDPNKLITNISINFWLYLGFLVLALGFLALIPLTSVIQSNIAEKIATIRGYQDSLSILNTDFVNHYIDNPYNPFGGLVTRIEKWGYLQVLWVFSMIISLIAGLPFIKLLLQHRYAKFTPKTVEFLNRKEEMKHTLNTNEIESFQLTKTSTILIIPKKSSNNASILMIDIKSVAPLKKYCIEHKIPTNEESNLVKMLVYQVSEKIKKIRNR